jgi:putative FmdB family regulatory protein
MPIFEYFCPTCGPFETISKAPQRLCERCGAVVERLPSAAAIRFKGRGFYETDYKKKTGERE